MKIQPYFLGRGAAAQAIEKSLRLLQVTDSGFEILPSIQLSRGDSFPREKAAGVGRVAILANPHALHADAILDAEKAGFDFVFAEKPVAISAEQIARLRAVKIPVAVFHGYRVAWGPETLRAMIAAGDLGEIFAVEGRYWQSSIAAGAIAATPPPEKWPDQGGLRPPEKWPDQGGLRPPEKWKDDPKLSGPHDVLLDLATHWVDLASFLVGAVPSKIDSHIFHVNAPSPHRDTHLQLSMAFGNIRGHASVSKIVHGTGNEIEVHVLGSKGAGSWRFMDPDRLVIGRGSETRIINRTDASLGSKQWGFHGVGWLEGYVEILRRGLRELTGVATREHKGQARYPDLASSISILEPLLSCSRPKHT